MFTPTVVIGFEALLALAMVSFIVMRVVEQFIKPLAELVNNLLPVAGETREERKSRLAEWVANAKRQWPAYLTMAIAGYIMWYTKITALQIFVDEEVGRRFTIAAAALGPSFLFDVVKGFLEFCKAFRGLQAQE